MCARPRARHPEDMATNELATFSDQLAGTVERAAPSVVAVHARPRFSSSGVFWRPGVIVTAEHTIRREDEIAITLPDGSNVSATLAGSDPGTDLAVLKTDSAGQAPPPLSAEPAPGHLALAIGRSQDSGVNATLGHRQRPRSGVAHLARRPPRPLYPARPDPLPRLLRRPGGEWRGRSRGHRHLGAFPHRRRRHSGLYRQSRGGRNPSARPRPPRLSGGRACNRSSCPIITKA